MTSDRLRDHAFGSSFWGAGSAPQHRDPGPQDHAHGRRLGWSSHPHEIVINSLTHFPARRHPGRGNPVIEPVIFGDAGSLIGQRSRMSASIRGPAKTNRAFGSAICTYAQPSHREAGGPRPVRSGACSRQYKAPGLAQHLQPTQVCAHLYHQRQEYLPASAHPRPPKTHQRAAKLPPHAHRRNDRMSDIHAHRPGQETEILCRSHDSASAISPSAPSIASFSLSGPFAQPHPVGVLSLWSKLQRVTAKNGSGNSNLWKRRRCTKQSTRPNSFASHAG